LEFLFQKDSKGIPSAYFSMCSLGTGPKTERSETACWLGMKYFTGLFWPFLPEVTKHENGPRWSRFSSPSRHIVPEGNLHWQSFAWDVGKLYNKTRKHSILKNAIFWIIMLASFFVTFVIKNESKSRHLVIQGEAFFCLGYTYNMRSAHRSKPSRPEVARWFWLMWGSIT